MNANASLRSALPPRTALLWAAAVCLASDAVAAPSPPGNIACRPDGAALDSVRITWTDPNDGSADYIVQRQDISGGAWSSIGTVSNGTEFIDSNAGVATVYRYRVIADDNGDQSVPSPICREPLALDSAGGNFRIFYRLLECPPVADGGTCVQNLAHPAQLAEIFEQYRTVYTGLGFNDPAIFGGAKPFPIDFFPCNNGCSNGDGIQIPPAKFGDSPYNPATGIGDSWDYYIPGHELFHKVQAVHGGSSDPFYKWVIEGQARAMQGQSVASSRTRVSAPFGTIAPIHPMKPSASPFSAEPRSACRSNPTEPPSFGRRSWRSSARSRPNQSGERTPCAISGFKTR